MRLSIYLYFTCLERQCIYLKQNRKLCAFLSYFGHPWIKGIFSDETQIQCQARQPIEK